jgi:hypothetical protein
MSWKDKKEWWEKQRKKHQDINDLATNSGLANPWHYKR